MNIKKNDKNNSRFSLLGFFTVPLVLLIIDYTVLLAGLLIGLWGK